MSIESYYYMLFISFFSPSFLKVIICPWIVEIHPIMVKNVRGLRDGVFHINSISPKEGPAKIEEAVSIDKIKGNKYKWLYLKQELLSHDTSV